MTSRHIVVPFVVGRLHPETRQWASDEGVVPHELPLAHDAYWKALVGWWKRPGDLAVVEQDVVPAPGVVTEMLDCPHPWCSSPYALWLFRPAGKMPKCWVTFNGMTSVPYHRPPLFNKRLWLTLWITDGLGCVAFSDELKRSFPDLMIEAGKSTLLDRAPQGDWRVTDRRLAQLLRREGITPHLHERSTHHHVPHIRHV